MSRRLVETNTKRRAYMLLASIYKKGVKFRVRASWKMEEKENRRESTFDLGAGLCKELEERENRVREEQRLVRSF